MKISKRRKFIKQFSAGALSALAIPIIGSQVEAFKLPTNFNPNDEPYWQLVKDQFAIPADKIMANAANLCPTTYAINERVVEYIHALGKDVSFGYREVFTDLRKQSITLLAEYVGVDKEEIGITRNTSESNCTIIQGLDFKQGDEVIIWEQNHQSNREAWMSKAKRYGFTVKSISVPREPKTKNDLLEPFIKATTSKTKLIAFSHISNVSGIALPAKEICQFANSKNILTLVDGAQSFGFLDLNLHDMGCSFYTASTHKWFMGPFENGLLYVRKDHTHRIWPNIIGGGWKESSILDENICVLGQRNEAYTAALPDAIQLHKTIGKQVIQNRVVELAAYFKDRIREKLPQATFVTPFASELSGGIVIINFPGKDPRELFQKLYEFFGIACAPSGGVRISPHIYNTKADLDTILNALIKLAV